MGAMNRRDRARRAEIISAQKAAKAKVVAEANKAAKKAAKKVAKASSSAEDKPKKRRWSRKKKDD